MPTFLSAQWKVHDSNCFLIHRRWKENPHFSFHVLIGELLHLISWRSFCIHLLPWYQKLSLYFHKSDLLFAVYLKCISLVSCLPHYSCRVSCVCHLSLFLPPSFKRFGQASFSTCNMLTRQKCHLETELPFSYVSIIPNPKNNMQLAFWLVSLALLAWLSIYYIWTRTHLLSPALNPRST